MSILYYVVEDKISKLYLENNLVNNINDWQSVF